VARRDALPLKCNLHDKCLKAVCPCETPVGNEMQKSEVLLTLTLKIISFWDVTGCTPVDTCQGFGGACCRLLHGGKAIRAGKNSVM
jgi:hypothetical protein